MTVTVPRAEIDAVMERHHDGWRARADVPVETVREIADRVRRINLVGEADDLDALADRYEKETA